MQAPFQWMPGFSVAVLLAGCVQTPLPPAPPPAASVGAPLATLTGTLAYRQRIDTPTGAVVEVALIDAGGSDSPGPAVAGNRFPVAGQPPFTFSLTYDPSRLQSGRRYAVQARILVDGKPWMVTGTVNHLMEFGRIAHAEILLQPAQAPAP